jgi:dihydroorotate dehydrogenase
MFRLPPDRALINRLGFNNDGAVAAAQRLSHRRAGTIGINIGKTKRVSETEAIADFTRSAQLLAPLADYLVVNVSSPNTPGLRDLQAVDKLRPLLTAVRAACDLASPMRRVPLLVKIAPDLADDELRDICEVVRDHRIDGLICGNTTLSREGLKSKHREEQGGLSGEPLFERSTAVLKRVYELTEGRLPLIGVGGVASGEHAYAKIRAGASLVQLYTGLVYGGIGLARRIAQELSRILEKQGFTSVAGAVGADHR